jgi:hypothetical protein
MSGFGSTEELMEYGGGAAGAIATAIVTKAVSSPSKTSGKPLIENVDLQAAAPVIAGAALAHFGKKNKALRTAGIVMASIGIANLAKAHIPAIQGICGEEDGMPILDLIQGPESKSPLLGPAQENAYSQSAYN